MRRFIRLSFLVRLSFLLALSVTLACEDSNGSPTTPIVTSNAAITGTIVNQAGGSSTISTGTVVRILGTNLSTAVDVNQQFALSNVPPSSNVILEFTGTGLNSQIPVGAVADGDRIALTLARNSNTLVVDSSGRQGANGNEVTGRIDTINGAAGSFTIGTATIQTNAATQFIGATGAAGTFNDLNVGLRVTASGTMTSPNTILATTVRGEAPIPGQSVTLTGAVSDLSGTANDFQFTVQGRVVRGGPNTTFSPGRTFINLQNGILVQVTGTNQVGFVQAGSILFP